MGETKLGHFLFDGTFIVSGWDPALQIIPGAK
jgi:hypothetical protein